MHFLNGYENRNWLFSWSNWEKEAIEIDLNEELKINIPDSSSSQIDENWTTDDIKRLDQNKIDALVGPVKVNGLYKHDFLKIEILDIKTGKFGWSAIMSNFGLLKNKFKEKLIIWHISDNYAESKDNFLKGLKVPVNPMLGIIGTSPESGNFPVIPPQFFGGNLDNKYIKKGSSVYLPVNRDGAFFALADPHASQGNGEVCGTGIETSAKVTLKVSKSSSGFDYPMVESYLKFDGPVSAFLGIDPDLYTAAQKALENFINYCVNKGLTAEEAYILASVAGNLEVSEIVDEPNLEVSLVVSKDILANLF